MQILKDILNMGPAVLMPLIFLIVGLIFKVKLGKAFNAALLVGIGFTGLNAIINLLLDALGPATQAMIKRFGIHLTIMDTGWANSSTIGWGSSLMPIAVFLFLIINIILFTINFTSTIDVDIFNYWIFLTCGAVLYAATKNFWLCIVLMCLLFVLLLKIGDWTAPQCEKAYGLKGVSFPHMNTAPWTPIGIFVNWIVDRIPGLNKISISPEKINKKFGIFGNSSFIGFILGILIGILANWKISKILNLGIVVAASMYLIPVMVNILMKGLNIIREAVEKVFKKKYPNRKFFIGMDVALMAGDPAVLATGILLIPIALILAAILPGNKVLPLVDLPSIIFVVTMPAAYCKKDIFRMLLSGIVIITIIMYAGTSLGPIYTEAAKMSGAAIPKGISQVISLNSGVTNPLGWLFVEIGRLIGNII